MPKDSDSILRRPAETVAEAVSWWAYLPDMGHDAREWYAAYEKFGNKPSRRIAVIIHDLRRRRLERAWHALEGCRVDINETENLAPRAVATVVEISYLSMLAYYHYHAAEPNVAREVLVRAVSLIEETLNLAPFLVPVAGQCYDYRLHLARIARTESRWNEMFEQINIGRKMVRGELPLCQAAWGPVYLKDICAFYGSATPLNEVEREVLQRLSDPRTVQREYHNLCLAATVVPFIVINWQGD